MKQWKIDTSINFLPKYWQSLKVQIELNSNLVLNLINQKKIACTSLAVIHFLNRLPFCFPFLIARSIQLLFVVNFPAIFKREYQIGNTKIDKRGFTSLWVRQIFCKCLIKDFLKLHKIWFHLNNFYFLHFIGGNKGKKSKNL